MLSNAARASGSKARALIGSLRAFAGQAIPDEDLVELFVDGNPVKVLYDRFSACTSTKHLGLLFVGSKHVPLYLSFLSGSQRIKRHTGL